MTLTPESIHAAVKAGVESGISAALQKQSGSIGCTTCLICTTDQLAVDKHKDHHARLDGWFVGVAEAKTEIFSSIKQAAITFFKWAMLGIILLMFIGLTRITWTDVLAAFGIARGSH